MYTQLCVHLQNAELELIAAGSPQVQKDQQMLLCLAPNPFSVPGRIRVIEITAYWAPLEWGVLPQEPDSSKIPKTHPRMAKGHPGFPVVVFLLQA